MSRYLVPRSTSTYLSLKNLSLNEASQSNLKSWQIALLIGIPSATLLAYFLYTYQSKKNKNEKKDENEKKQSEKKLSSFQSENKKINQSKAEESSHVAKNPLSEAIKKKNVGNEYFHKADYEMALKLYTEAINLCPLDDRVELPKFYQNRAATYENLVQKKNDNLENFENNSIKNNL